MQIDKLSNRVSLCACGDQKIQSKSKQGSATQQVVQEQMANATGETTAPPTACCSQGLEFVLAGEHSYPADYPELGTEITVVGTFQTYEENGYMDCHLVDAEITE